MNLILLHPKDQWIDPSNVRLSDDRFLHLRNVLHADVGQLVHVGVVGGRIGEGLVTSVDQNGVCLRIRLSLLPPPRHRLDLIIALPRPKMLRRIFRTVAEFGVSNLHLINSARVEKSYWQTPLLSSNKVHDALCAGLSRSSDTILPQIHFHRRFRPFVEDELADLCGGRPCWLADHGAPMALTMTASVPSVVMVGPEGGFVPFEISLAESVIAQRAHLGQRILSVDTAVTSVLAQTL
ncbi:16S rRNA (uracil(1498)-N(3))-methyltransferase [Synechococcus sp. MIT S1220]|uniref:16S rRNA (uracil(1498)-N(3))-methyltransferase n=1 Tax=Synechococcus sp. MIT S1220 TaxID=3082549 RepID=UPI0039B04F5A